MKNIPLLDPRLKEDIIKEIQEKAKSYTPQWRYDPEDMDAGGAIAEIFAGMFYETVDRFNRVPYKNFIEFLNMLNVSKNPATPSRGYVKFEADTPNVRGVHIKKGTQVYAEDPEGNGNDVVFETEKSFDTTTARIEKVLLVDGRKDSIETVDFEAGSIEFFAAHPDKNIQRHEFYLGHEDMLPLKRPSFVEIRLGMSISMMTDKVIGRLTDPGFACWEYFDGERWTKFDEVRADKELIIAEKRGDSPICRHEEDKPCSIRCTMSGGEDKTDILAERIEIRTGYLDEWAQPDEVFFNDNPIDTAVGGYCFGKLPVGYDCFYLASDEVLGKRDAQISVSFNMRTIVEHQMTPEQQYEFKKFIVDKNDKINVVPEIYISELVWEYWNGAGWRRLQVSGDVNPFSCRREGNMALSFVNPRDMGKIEVNAVTRYWIRARVAFVENNFSLTGDKLLPFVKDTRLTFKYDKFKPVEYITTTNNCESRFFEGTDKTSQSDMPLYHAMPIEPPTVYLMFDKPLRGYPVNLYFELDGQFIEKRDLEFQTLSKNDFKKVKLQDFTDDFSDSGIVGLFLSEAVEKGSCFGNEGYWLRVIDNGQRRKEGRPLPVKKIETNVVSIIQSRSESDKVFPSSIYEANMELRLDDRPVISCEVWVDELSDISAAELGSLIEAGGDSVKAAYDDEENMTAFQVLWSRVTSFGGSGPESRHYILDPVEGKLTFGDGRHGKVPSVGERSILVKYSSGGGTRGNLPAGAVNALIHSVAYVNKVSNIAPTCGGSDVQSLETVEKLGPRRIKHRYRAVCAQDFEAIVLEHFSEVLDVRCFSHKDAYGKESHGAVTVVVMARNYENRDYARQLCQRIRLDLEGCCDCMVLAGEKLSVIPATVVTANVTVTITLDSDDFAAEAEQGVLSAISHIIQPSGTDMRGIGNFPSALDFFRELKYVEHIAAVRDVMLEGSYYENNLHRLINIDGKTALPFAVVLNGTHTVRM